MIAKILFVVLIIAFLAVSFLFLTADQDDDDDFFGWN